MFGPCFCVAISFAGQQAFEKEKSKWQLGLGNARYCNMSLYLGSLMLIDHSCGWLL